MILVKPSDFSQPSVYQLAQSASDAPLLQSYIDRYEKQTIYHLLGKELAYLLIAYIQSVKPTQTIGPLVVGNYYQITTYIAGDDFSNVGGSNIQGSYFIATGDTPTVWNGSLLTTCVLRYENILNPFYDQCENYFWYGYHGRSNVYESLGLKELLIINIFYWYVSQTQVRHSQSGIQIPQSENSSVGSPADAMRYGETKWNVEGLDTYTAIQYLCKIKSPDIYPEYSGIKEKVRYSSLF